MAGSRETRVGFTRSRMWRTRFPKHRWEDAMHDGESGSAQVSAAVLAAEVRDLCAQGQSTYELRPIVLHRDETPSGAYNRRIRLSSPVAEVSERFT